MVRRDEGVKGWRGEDIESARLEAYTVLGQLEIFDCHASRSCVDLIERGIRGLKGGRLTVVIDQGDLIVAHEPIDY